MPVPGRVQARRVARVCLPLPVEGQGPNVVMGMMDTPSGCSKA